MSLLLLKIARDWWHLPVTLHYMKLSKELAEAVKMPQGFLALPLLVTEAERAPNSASMTLIEAPAESEAGLP